MQNNLKMITRKTARTSTRLTGTVKYGLQKTLGRVVNLSASGIALDLNGPFHAAAGSHVKIESDDLGYIEGMVRWCRNGRIGVQFNPNSNAHAQVASYFRFFHKDPRQSPFGIGK